MNVCLVPVDFVWPDTKNRNGIVVDLNGDIIVSDLQAYIKSEYKIYPLISIQLEGLNMLLVNKPLSYYQIVDGQNLFLFEKEPVNNIIANIYIDGQDAFLPLDVFLDSTGQEITDAVLGIDGFQHYKFVKTVISAGNQSSDNKHFQLKTIGSFKEYRIDLYTTLTPIKQAQITTVKQIAQIQQPDKQQQNNSQNQQQVSKQLTPELCTKNLVVLSNMTIIVAIDGSYVVYKYHKFKGEGILRKSKGRPYKSNSDLVFIKINNIQLAQHTDYGVSILWDNGTYSSIRVNLRT